MRDMSSPTSLNGPISLLWAHQLRREHATLLTKIENLASQVSNVSNTVKPAQLKKVSTSAEKALTKANAAEIAVSKVSKEISELQKQSVGLTHEMNELQNTTQTHTETVEVLSARLDQIAQKSDRAVNGVTSLRDEILLQVESNAKDARIDVSKVNDKVIELSQTLEDFKVLVENQQTSLLPPLEAIKGEGDDLFLMLAIIDHLSAREQQSMPPPPSRPKISHASDLLDSIDLDENIQTPDPEDRLQQLERNDHNDPMLTFGDGLPPSYQVPTDASEKMHMLPLPVTQNQQEILGSPDLLPESRMALLRQRSGGADDSKFQQAEEESLDEYLGGAEDVLTSVPKRKHASLIDEVVEGIRDVGARSDLTRFLDEHDWSWRHVQAFLEKRRKHSAMHVEAFRRLRSKEYTEALLAMTNGGPPTHRHPPEEQHKCIAGQGTGTVKSSLSPTRALVRAANPEPKIQPQDLGGPPDTKELAPDSSRPSKKLLDMLNPDLHADPPAKTNVKTQPTKEKRQQAIASSSSKRPGTMRPKAKPTIQSQTQTQSTHDVATQPSQRDQRASNRAALKELDVNKKIHEAGKTNRRDGNPQGNDRQKETYKRKAEIVAETDDRAGLLPAKQLSQPGATKRQAEPSSKNMNPRKRRRRERSPLQHIPICSSSDP